jgi:CRISPR/Cas system-associated exonuclease Cas4 (RecB family)
MTFTVGEFSHFTRCPELYELHDIQGVPMPPTTNMVVGRVVRLAVRAELLRKLTQGTILDAIDARQSVERIAVAEMSQDVAYTAEESAQGQRNIYEMVLRRSLRLIGVWRAAVAPRVTPIAIDREFSVTVGAHTITGNIEIEEVSCIRITRVRQRRPPEDEAQHDLVLHLQSCGKPAIVDYLIDAEPYGVARQAVDVDDVKQAAIRERVDMMARCRVAGLYPPTDSKYWRCQNCSLRSCCRYV